MPSDISIRCLLVSARYGSFTKAADELYMTRQAVSQQIAALERELDAKLFDRTTAKVTPTPVGELYISYFTDALRQWEEVRRKADAILTREGETIRVGSPYATDLGNQVLTQVEHSRSRGRHFEVIWERREPQELLNQLLEGKHDVVFVFERALNDFPDAEKLEHFTFARTQGVVAVHSKYPKVCPGITAKDLEGEPCYLAEGMQPSEQSLLREFSEYGLRFRNVQVLSNRDSVQSMVQMCCGITICTDMERFIHYPSILSYPTGRYQNIFCVWRRDEPRPQVLQFVSAMQQAVEN